MSMPRRPIHTMLAIIAALAVASCNEKPPRADPEVNRTYSNETPQHPAYERTVKQGEVDQMGK